MTKDGEVVFFNQRAFILHRRAIPLAIAIVVVYRIDNFLSNLVAR